MDWETQDNLFTRGISEEDSLLDNASLASLPLETQQQQQQQPAEPTLTTFSRIRQKRRAFGSAAVDKAEDLNPLDDLSNSLRQPTERELQSPRDNVSDLFDNQSNSSNLFLVNAEQDEAEGKDDDDLVPQIVVATPMEDQDPSTDQSEDEMEEEDFEDSNHKEKAASHFPQDSLATVGDLDKVKDSNKDPFQEEEKEWDMEKEEDAETPENREKPDCLAEEPSEPTSKATTAKAVDLESSVQHPSPAKETTEKKEKKKPDRQSLINSTDQLFLQVTDRTKVTVKDILQSLQTEYDCPKFDKASKTVVKERLTALILGNAQPLQNSDDESESEEDREDSESEASVEEVQGDDSDFEASKPHKKISRKKTPSKKKATKEKRGRIKRRSASAVKAAAVRIQAEQLRKKRLEELRVRNEELQLLQSREEQKRAASIAAKLETDTEEIRQARLEQRLDLLQKLDQKRFMVIQEAAALKIQQEKDEDPDEKLFTEDQSEEEESSEDEMELEIVGQPSKPLVPLKPDAISLLSWADKGIRAPSKKNPVKAVSKPAVSESSTDDFLSLLNQTKQTRHSPGQSLNARAFLKKRLLSRQRRMGNQWLARELGYENERDHVEDCLKVENQKRLLTLKQEQERIEANERKMLRERWVKAEEGSAVFDEDNKGSPLETEQDEEMAVALELNQVETDSATPSSDVDDKEDGDSLSLVDATTKGDQKDQDNVAVAPLAEVVPNATSHDDESVVEATEKPMPLVTRDTDTVQSTESGNVVAEMAAVSAENTADEMENSDDLGESGRDYPDDLQFKTQPPMISPVDETVGEEKDENAEEEESAVEQEKPKGPRNSAWREMLKREAEKVKKLKKRKGEMIDDQAEEEEEEEIVGLEDFGFAMHKKKKPGDDDDENEGDYELNENDMEDVVDDVSVGEGDEEAGEQARKAMELQEEKEQHREIMRRMREGYDGRRGGIAGGGAGARGVHRFDQLVAADNREGAKRLGLLNDDELDSEDEKDNGNDDEEEDEAAYLDKMLKDRFLHRSSIDLEENFSEDEDADENKTDNISGEKDEDMEEKEQERMAKRFTKRARMQRLIETHGQDEEFSQLKLIEEDTTLKEELMKIKVCNTPPCCRMG